MRRQRTPTFAAKDVCRALNVPHGTLNSWAFHGLFKGLDAEKTTPGKARRFTLADLFRLGILNYLMGFGISAERARVWAMQCVSYMDHAPLSEMTISVYRDHDEIRLDDELMSEPAAPGILLRLTIFPAEIVRTLQERLAEPVADAKADA